ncbi:tyrosine-type recombinase/integrase [Ferrimonas kyonanensis]|uniref:tyrosine-type recombinase/integrase n=1 Tax=Ferrimonas kyonanensis TaxID=364763 RepID=UPI0003F9706D|nr:tyrosine-type recombinase/integrase [Ferrimonas kyonanensis]
MTELTPLAPTQLVPANTDFDCAAFSPALIYLQELGSDLSRQKMISYLNVIARLLNLDHYRQIDWAAIGKPQVLYLLDQLRRGALMRRPTAQGRSPNTVNLYLALIKGVARRAYEMGLYEHRHYSQIQSIRRLRGSRVNKGREVTKSEIQSLLRQCRHDCGPKGCRDLALLSLLFGTGVRRAELVGIDLAHLDRHQATIRVIGKGNKERLLYLNQPTLTALTEYIDTLRGEDQGPLFQPITKLGDLLARRMTPQAVKVIIDARNRQARVASFSPHDGRRTFATQLLCNGVDLHTVQKLMGHASIDTTRQYDMRGEEVMRQAVSLLE